MKRHLVGALSTNLSCNQLCFALYKWLNYLRPHYEYLHSKIRIAIFSIKNFTIVSRLRLSFFSCSIKGEDKHQILRSFYTTTRNHTRTCTWKEVKNIRTCTGNDYFTRLCVRSFRGTIRGNKFQKNVNLTANPVFFSVNCIHNPFANSELITTCPEKKGTLYAIFWFKKITAGIYLI